MNSISHLDAFVSDPRFLVREVVEIVYRDGTTSGLQQCFVDGTSLVCTVSTDWTLRADHLDGWATPEHYWPSSDFRRVPIPIGEIAAPIRSMTVTHDEVGHPMEILVELSDLRLLTRFFGGDLVIDR